MRLNKILIFPVWLLLVSGNGLKADILVSQTFKSTDKRVELVDSVPDINKPGGKWIKTAGFEWAKPFITATWDPPNLMTDVAILAENPTGLAIALTGEGFVKPASFTISATMVMYHAEASATNGSVALGFYSALPAADTGTDTEKLGLIHFTGLRIYQTGALLETDVAGNGKLEWLVDGEVAGSAVELAAPLLLNKPFTVSYTVDTKAGTLSGLLFDGKSPFADGKDVVVPLKNGESFTAYAAFVACGGGGARGAMADFSVKSN